MNPNEYLICFGLRIIKISIRQNFRTPIFFLRMHFISCLWNIFYRCAEYRLSPSGAFKGGMVGFQPSAGFIHSAKFKKDKLQNGDDQ